MMTVQQGILMAQLASLVGRAARQSSLPSLACFANVDVAMMGLQHFGTSANKVVVSYVRLPEPRRDTYESEPANYLELLGAIANSKTIGRLHYLVHQHRVRMETVHVAAALTKLPKLVRFRHQDLVSSNAICAKGSGVSSFRRVPGASPRPTHALRAATLAAELSALLPSHQRTLYPRQIANCVWALGRLRNLGVQTPAALARPLLDALQPDLLNTHGAGLDVAQLLSGLVHLSPQRRKGRDAAAEAAAAAALPPPAAAEAPPPPPHPPVVMLPRPVPVAALRLAQFVESQPSKLLAGDVPMTMYGFARLGLVSRQALWAALVQQAGQHVKFYSPPSLGKIFMSLASAVEGGGLDPLLPSPPPAPGHAAAPSSSVAHSTPASQLLSAPPTKAPPGALRSLLDRLAAGVEPQLVLVMPHDVELIVDACARLQYKEEALLQVLAAKTVRDMERFTPHSIAKTLHSFAQLGLAVPRLYSAAASSLLAENDIAASSLVAARILAALQHPVAVSDSEEEERTLSEAAKRVRGVLLKNSSTDAFPALADALACLARAGVQDAELAAAFTRRAHELLEAAATDAAATAADAAQQQQQQQQQPPQASATPEAATPLAPTDGQNLPRSVGPRAADLVNFFQALSVLSPASASAKVGNAPTAAAASVGQEGEPNGAAATSAAAPVPEYEQAEEGQWQDMLMLACRAASSYAKSGLLPATVRGFNGRSVAEVKMFRVWQLLELLAGHGLRDAELAQSVLNTTDHMLQQQQQRRTGAASVPQQGVNISSNRNGGGGGGRGSGSPVGSVRWALGSFDVQRFGQLLLVVEAMGIPVASAAAASSSFSPLTGEGVRAAAAALAADADALFRLSPAALPTLLAILSEDRVTSSSSMSSPAAGGAAAGDAAGGVRGEAASAVVRGDSSSGTLDADVKAGATAAPAGRSSSGSSTGYSALLQAITGHAGRYDEPTLLRLAETVRRVSPGDNMDENRHRLLLIAALERVAGPRGYTAVMRRLEE